VRGSGEREGDRRDDRKTNLFHPFALAVHIGAGDQGQRIPLWLASVVDELLQLTHTCVAWHTISEQVVHGRVGVVSRLFEAIAKGTESWCAAQSQAVEGLREERVVLQLELLRSLAVVR
jgi:hypothetical protein